MQWLGLTMWVLPQAVQRRQRSDGEGQLYERDQSVGTHGSPAASVSAMEASVLKSISGVMYKAKARLMIATPAVAARIPFRAPGPSPLGSPQKTPDQIFIIENSVNRLTNRATAATTPYRPRSPREPRRTSTRNQRWGDPGKTQGEDGEGNCQTGAASSQPSASG